MTSTGSPTNVAMSCAQPRTSAHVPTTWKRSMARASECEPPAGASMGVRRTLRGCIAAKAKGDSRVKFRADPLECCCLPDISGVSNNFPFRLSGDVTVARTARAAGQG